MHNGQVTSSVPHLAPHLRDPNPPSRPGRGLNLATNTPQRIPSQPRQEPGEGRAPASLTQPAPRPPAALGRAEPAIASSGPRGAQRAAPPHPRTPPPPLPLGSRPRRRGSLTARPRRRAGRWAARATCASPARPARRRIAPTAVASLVRRSQGGKGSASGVRPRHRPRPWR